VLSKDLDDDSNERDPFSFRYFDINNLRLDYALSDRDIRHKFNFMLYSELPGGFEVNTRIQARSAQPNHTRCAHSDQSQLDAQRQRVLLLRLARLASDQIRRALRHRPDGGDVQHLQQQEPGQSADDAGLFNFDGFLRQGVGDPRQLQLAVKFTF
jgi:hypothetical protein